MIAFKHERRIDFVSKKSAGSSRKPRILYVGEAVALAHVGRPAMLARWSRESGYDVHFACGQAFASVAAAEGFTPHILHTINAATFLARVKTGEFFYTADELDAYVCAELALIEEVQPDLIVGDFRHTLAISAGIAGIPLVSLINAYWSPATDCRFSLSHIGMFRVLPVKLREAMFSVIRPLAFRMFAQPLNVVRRRYGFAPLHDFRKLFTAGKFCAYVDLPEFVDVPKLPRGHFMLGPIAWEPRCGKSPELGSLGALRPMAYVTLGSTGDARVLPNVLLALLRSNCDIALTGVSTENFSALQRSLPELNGRCIAAPLINPREVLKRAAITVCHGGSGTVYQSLAAGVPVLCLPGNSDQGLVAAAVLAQGVGKVIEPGRTSVPLLAATLGVLLNDAQYKTSAKSMARSIAQHDTRECWLNFLNSSLPIEAIPSPSNFQGTVSAAPMAHVAQANTTKGGTSC